MEPRIYPLRQPQVSELVIEARVRDSVQADGRPSELVDIFAPRRLSPRQVDVINKLLAAAVEEAEASGPDGFTVRGAARRAGVAPATAYNYFSCKEHLLAEAMWRRMHDLPLVEGESGGTTYQRVVKVLSTLGTFVADMPGFSAACTVALLSSSPDVKRLLAKIAGEIHRRITLALGNDADPSTVITLEMAYSGAMITVGMGYLTFADLPGQLEQVARCVLGDTK